MSSPTKKEVTQEDNELMKFLFIRSEQSETPLAVGQMCQEFVDAHKTSLSAAEWRYRFVNVMSPKMMNIQNYSIDAVAKLYFVTSTIVPRQFLKRLKENAEVEADCDGRILKYKGERLRFQGEHDVEDRVRRFSGYNTVKATVERLYPVICIDDSELTTPKSQENRGDISVLVPPLQLNRSHSSYNLRTRPVASNKRHTRHRSHFLETRDNYYDEKPEKFHESEDRKILEYLEKRAKRSSNAPLPMSRIWGEFVRETGTKRTQQEVQSRFQTRLAPRIDENHHFDFDTRVLLLFVSGTSVNEKFFERLKRHGHITLDENRQIVKYHSLKNKDFKLKRMDAWWTEEKKAEDRKRSRRDSQSSSSGVHENESKRRKTHLLSNNNEGEIIIHREIGASESSGAIHAVLSDDKEHSAQTQVENQIIEDVMSGIRHQPSDVFKELANASSIETSLLDKLIDIMPTVEIGPISPVQIPKREYRITIDLRDFLKQLKIMVLSLNTLSLADINMQLTQYIEILASKERLILITEVLCVLRAAMVTISQSIKSSQAPAELVKSASDFLKVFNCFVESLESPTFKDIQYQLKEMIEDPTTEDKVIMLTDIQLIINCIITVFCH